MKMITVELDKATKQGRLYPRYDNEADILEVSSEIERSWPYGVDIDGTVIFDLDRDGILANFDLLIPMQSWKMVQTLEDLPVSHKANLKFSSETLKHKSFSLPIEVITNIEKSRVLIMFNRAEKMRNEVIELSERAFALIFEDQLVGFFLKL